jgi:hypothetical protein
MERSRSKKRHWKLYRAWVLEWWVVIGQEALELPGIASLVPGRRSQLSESGGLLPKLARKSVRPSVPVGKPAQRMATFHRSTPPARGRSPVDALENLSPWLAGPVISEYEWWGAAPRALVTADCHRGSWDRGRDGVRGMLCTEGPASCRYEKQELGQTPRTKHPDWPPWHLIYCDAALLRF